MTPLTVVTFKWKPPVGYRSSFGPETVHALQQMVARHYPHPHRFVCITDDATGLDGIETLPLWSDYATVPNPMGRHNPSCYRRLKLFAPEMGAVLGPRFVCMDLDTVIVGDITPILHRPEPFIIWGQADHPKQWYNGSLFMQTAGARSKVWTTFDPETSPGVSKRGGKAGSDQGWISYCLGEKEAVWTKKDGIYSYRVDIAPKGNRLPENARMVMFHGRRDPWGYECQQIPWIKAHYPQIEVTA